MGACVPGRDRRHAAGLAVAPVARAAGARGIAAGRGAAGAGGFRAAVRTHRPLAGADAPVRPDLRHRRMRLGALRERADGLRELRARSGTRRARRRRCRPWSSGRWPATPGRAIRQLVSVLRTLRVLAGPSGVAGLSMLPEEIQRGGVDAARHAPRQPGGVAAQPAGLGRRGHPRRRWPRMAAMSAVRRVCWACTAARCTGAWRRWKRQAERP